MNEIELLEWQFYMGVDETLSASPLNHLVENNKTSLPPLSNVTALHNNGHKPTQIASQAKEKTLEIAERCNSIEELHDSIVEIDFISIKKTAMNTVFSDGNPGAEIMFIGEAPGAEEDKKGIPFCGASGKLLDQALSYIGLYREKNFYITNTIFWRPPGNRRPTPEELDICLPVVEKHIALIKPKLVILVGGTATSSILNSKKGITKLRGINHTYDNVFLKNPIDLTAIFHPSYLLRQPGRKKLFWQDLLRISDFIDKKDIAI